jgi:hypothetical protein
MVGIRCAFLENNESSEKGCIGSMLLFCGNLVGGWFIGTGRLEETARDGRGTIGGREENCCFCS